jgi:histone deacetylase complex regulatory component SIN3
MAESSVLLQRPNQIQSLMYGKELANRLMFDSGVEMFRYFQNTLLRPLIMGEIDQGKFEDQVREMFGTQSFILFTLDKLVLQVARQVCNLN